VRITVNVKHAQQSHFISTTSAVRTVITQTLLVNSESTFSNKMSSKSSVANRRNERSYRYGRWLLIGLALVSIPLDGQKMYEEVGKAKIYLNKSMYTTINFYSATLMTHVVGLSSAFDHEIWLTVACRLVCTFVYQYDLSTRSNDTIPTDPKEMQKMLKEKYPQYLDKMGSKAGDGKAGKSARPGKTAKTSKADSFSKKSTKSKPKVKKFTKKIEL
jgi:hypothetical protein